MPKINLIYIISAGHVFLKYFTNDKYSSIPKFLKQQHWTIASQNDIKSSQENKNGE